MHIGGCQVYEEVGGGRRRSNCLMGTGFPFGVTKMFWKQRWLSNKTLNTLNITKLFILKTKTKNPLYFFALKTPSLTRPVH